MTNDGQATPPDKVEPTIQRIGRGGYLHAIVPIIDKSGRVVERVVRPLMVELRARDVVQVIVGAIILAIPVGFTEEAWGLGERLGAGRIAGIAVVSVAAIALFVYMNFYRFYLRQYLGDYVKRVVSIYAISFLVVGALLALIDVAPWGVDNILAIKRTIVVALPASLSATLTDALK